MPAADITTCITLFKTMFIIISAHAKCAYLLSTINYAHVILQRFIIVFIVFLPCIVSRIFMLLTGTVLI